MKVTRTEKQIQVVSPYNPELPKEARKIGGKWDGSCWSFDIRDESRVGDLYLSIYGEWDTNGEIPADAVTARVTLTEDDYVPKGGVFFGGRQVARATGRDSGATIADGIIIIKGGFESGGSMKNWATEGKAGTIFEIRDIPLAKVKEEMEVPSLEWTVEIIGDVDHEALKGEKARLLERIAEINIILN